MAEIEEGKKVKIKTVKEELEGIILESHEPEIYLLKLNSGYNIGVKKEDVVDIKQVKEKEKKKTKEVKIKEKKLPKIDIIMTGGTISSQLDPETGGVKWLTTPEDLFKFYPRMFDIINVRKVKQPFMKASENMDFHDWKTLAQEVADSLNDKEVEGVILTHGTDFLHYTSAALSFFLKDINKPIVLTYSQRSTDRASSDAALNLQCSAYAALSNIAEVMLVGHASSDDNFCFAMPGTKVRKMHTSRRDTFKVINDKPYARITPTGEIEKIKGYRERDNKRKVKLDASYDDKIALVKFYPGFSSEIIEYYEKNYDGIVLEVSGLGHVATDEARNNLLPAIKRAVDNGLVVCGVAQTLYGRLDPYVYSPGRKLLKAGVIFLKDMLPETALVKLGWVLGKEKNKEKIRDLMLNNFAGEINERLEE